MSFSRYKILVPLMAFGIFFFASCKKTNDAGNLVPADVAMLMHVNGKNLQKKLPWTEVQQNPWFTKIMQDSSMTTLWKSLMQNPENSGIDRNNDFMMFSKTDSLGAYVGCVGNISDMDKFVAFSNQITNTSGKPDKNDDVFMLKNNSLLISWQAKKFLMLIDAPNLKLSEAYTDNMENLPTSPVEKKSTRNLTEQAMALYQLKNEGKLGSNDKFAAMMETEADVHLWLNAEALYENEMAMNMGPISMLNMDKLYKGSIIATSITFEEGKILTAVKAYAGKDVTDIWRKYGGNKIDKDLLERLPSKNIATEFALNFKPEGLLELLKLAGIDGFVNLFLNQLGITADDFIKSIKGDVFFAVTDIITDSTGNVKPQFIFAANINDQKSLDKLIGLAKQQSDKIMPGGEKVFFEQNKNLFAIGNDLQFVKDYLSGSKKQSMDMHKKLSSSAIAGFVDIQYVLNKITGIKSTDSLGTAMKNSSVKMWDNVVFSGGKFLNDGFVQNIEVNLMDKKTNSLKQLNNYFNELYQITNQYQPEIDSTRKAIIDSIRIDKSKQSSL